MTDKDNKKAYQEAYRKENADAIKKSQSEWYQKNKELTKARAKARYDSKRDEITEKHAEYRLANKDRQSELAKAWYQKNKKRVIKMNTEYKTERRKSAPQFRLRDNLRCRLYQAVRAGVGEKSGGTLKLTGCSLDHLKSHLESLFTEGMTWENYGEWHVDHIRPCSSFDLTIDKEQEICFNYSNLQPLWAKDNLSKSDKYDELTAANN